MRIAIYIPSNYNASVGGGFSYVEQIVSRLLSITLKHKFVPLFIVNDNEDIEQSLFYKKIKNEDQEIIVLNKKEKQISIFWSRLQKIAIKFKVWPLVEILTNFIINHQKENKSQQKQHLDEFLRANKIQLLYYPLPMENLHKDFPYFCTVWDLIHLKAPYFPEVANNGQFDSRQKLYQEILPRASGIIAESKQGKAELLEYFQTDKNKIHIVPMAPSAAIVETFTEEETQLFLEKHKLSRKNFFFYPANFWPHKNHYNLVHAFAHFSQKYPDFQLVFSGGDLGNLVYIQNEINSLQLTEKVKYLGFISFKEIKMLYTNAYALTMCTMFDPTSIPIVEAMACGCPVICTDTAGHREQTGNHALFVKAEDVEDIAEKLIYSVENVEKLQQQSEEATIYYSETIMNLNYCFSDLIIAFDSFEKHRMTWKY